MIVHEALCEACGKREPSECGSMRIDATGAYPVGWWLALRVPEPTKPPSGPVNAAEWSGPPRPEYQAFCSEPCLRRGPERTEPDIRDL